MKDKDIFFALFLVSLILMVIFGNLAGDKTDYYDFWVIMIMWSLVSIRVILLEVRHTRR